MKFILLIYLLTLNALVYAQSNYDTIIEGKAPNVINLNIPETLKIKNLTESEDNIFEQNMPWIAALIIGLLSVGMNFWVSHRLRQSNERNLQRQIENAKEITIAEFKATINTKNRQEWINTLRGNISELISIAITLSITFRRDPENVEIKDIINYNERLFICLSNIQMLLSDEKEEQQKVIEYAKILVNTCIETEEDGDYKIIDSKINELILGSRKLFEIHWAKIKNLK